MKSVDQMHHSYPEAFEIGSHSWDEGRRITLGPHEGVVRADADALDAVLCAFAAIAVTEDRLGVALPADDQDEGWIAVHR